MIAGLALLPRFAPVEDAEHQNGAAVVPVLKRLCATEDLKEDLAAFFATCYGSPKLRMPTEKVSPLDKLTGDARGEVGELFVQERGKSTEVGEGVERPFDLYWPGHCRNPGAPHVRSHCTTRSCGTREPSMALADRRSSSASSSASASQRGSIRLRSRHHRRLQVIDGARRDAGEPHLHELEPDGGLAEAGRRTPRGVKQLLSLPFRFGQTQEYEEGAIERFQFFGSQ